ncbi:MAG TPA: ATP-binding protein [Candidatus Thermoplasmatota archaeon]|nr:ATP-binding protein [Candidatus Thermoplasmatota archaeon]
MTREAAPYLRAVGAPLLVLGEGGVVRLANDALARLAGRPAGQLEGRPFADLGLVSSDVARDVVERHARGEGGEVDCVLRLPDRHVTAIRLAQSPVGDGASVVLLSDLTLVTRLAEQEKLAAMGTLVAGVAHEVRTPLAYMANNLHLLRHRVDEAVERGEGASAMAAEVVALVHEAMQGIDRINRLVVELRRFTRPGRNVRRVLSLHRAVEPAVALFEATSRGRATLRASLEPTAHVEVDESQVQQVVLNLLDNAADAAPGGVVTVDTRDGRDGPELRVTDEGAGIPLEALPHIFDALYTTKPHGTGLGLTIVDRIARDHGARVLVDTSPGKGTTFRVVFPRAQ